MSSIFFIRLLKLIILLVVQVLMLNNITVFGYATALMIGYLIITFNRGSSRSGLLLWGFVIGFLSDLCSDTPGMASSACTLLAMIQPVMLNLFISHDVAEDFSPTLFSMGVWRFIAYTFLLMLVLHSVFYILDAFTLNEWMLTLLSIISSTVLATVLTVFAELAIRRR